jgi:flagellar biosynthesis/type III secretory pathway protein FliH
MNWSPRPQTISVGRRVHSVSLAATPAGFGTGVPATDHGQEARATPPPTPRPTPPEEYARGVREGREQARRELATALAAASAAAQALEREVREQHRAMEHFALKLALCLASRIIGREVADGTEVRRLLAEALAHVPVQTNLIIRMNPQDVAVLEQFRGKLLAPHAALPSDVVFTPDESLARGGCIIESPMGLLDASFETQLLRLEAALLPEPAGAGGQDATCAV